MNAATNIHDCTTQERTHVKRHTDFDGSLMEQWRCGTCGSHRSSVLIESLKPTDLPNVVRLVKAMSSEFVAKFTLPELCWLIAIYRKAEYSLLPDVWTGEQVASALASGVVPRWETKGRDIQHALNVKDCRCMSCCRAKAVAG